MLVEKLLLKDPTLLNKKDSKGDSALELAYQNNNVEIMKNLVKMKASDCGPVFLRAVRAGKKDTVENFFNLGVNIETENSVKDTALFFAATNGYTDIVRLLINRGANLNHLNLDDESPLMVAYQLDRIDVIEVLIKAKCTGAEDILARAKADGKTKLIDLMQGWGVSDTKPAPKSP